MESLLKEMAETNIRAAKNTLTECDSMDQKFMAWKIGESDDKHQIFMIPLTGNMDFGSINTQTTLAIVLEVSKADGYCFASEAWSGQGKTKEEALKNKETVKRECLIIDCVERDLVDKTKRPNRVMTMIDFVRYGKEIVYGDEHVVPNRDATGRIGGKTLFDIKTPDVPNHVKENIRRQIKQTRL